MNKSLLLLTCCILAACEKKEAVLAPESPQEMYARVQQLLQPNIEHDASDFEQAMVWLRRAAEAGWLQAQTDLGGIYLEGGKDGVKADGKEAYYWFAKAAEQGSKESLYYMGLILYRGLNMPKDEAAAIERWKQAADAGVAEAQFRLGIELAQRETGIREGIRWLVKAVEAPAPKLAAQAASALGNIYATGKHGIPRDMAEAARWYALAAQGGDPAAQLVYAIMLLKGDPIEQNTQQGMRLLRLSAGQDYPQAIALLINLLRNGENAKEQEQEASAWAERLETLRQTAAPSSPSSAQNAPE